MAPSRTPYASRISPARPCSVTMPCGRRGRGTRSARPSRAAAPTAAGSRAGRRAGSPAARSRITSIGSPTPAVRTVGFISPPAVSTRCDSNRRKVAARSVGTSAKRRSRSAGGSARSKVVASSVCMRSMTAAATLLGKACSSLTPSRGCDTLNAPAAASGATARRISAARSAGRCAANDASSAGRSRWTPAPGWRVGWHALGERSGANHASPRSASSCGRRGSPGPAA